MKIKCLVLILFLLEFSYSREYTRGVIQPLEASFCMDLCSMYQLIPDTGYTYTNLTATPIIILEEYVGQHVEVWGEQTWCVECGALDVIEIEFFDDTSLECTNNNNCGDCFNAGCFWQPVATEGYQCNTECLIMDTACYGQGASWTAECPEDEALDCCTEAFIAEENCGGLGCFIPQCTDDCEWEPMQCWPSTGYCWCIDEFGNEIEGTSQPAWEGYPDCEDDDPQIGDECYSDDGDLYGYLDCHYDCTPLEMWDWLGDGWCDEDPWRIIQFNCEELGFDCGDCNPDWDGTDPLGFCEEEITCTQGDITNDSDVNVLDVVSMVNIILQLPSEDDPWDFWLCTGDFNGDGSINVLDVISLVNLILNPIFEDCYIIPEIGPCDGICPTYFYNQDTNQCEEFITGCCGVEAFDTQQSCEDVCE